MKTARLEAFTDGVLAIAITIMVLEMKVPHSTSWQGLREAAPLMLAYALSYVNVGLYWANHHHMLHATEHVDGRVLWANMFMLFWLSLAPWVIRWLDEAGFAPWPVAAYGVILGFAGLGFEWTQYEIIRLNGRDSTVARAVGTDWKGKMSVLGYAGAVGLAFVAAWVSIVIYVAISTVWLIPDRRIERELS